MKKNSVAADLAYIAVFTALVIALAFMAIPVGSAGVPIVLQNAALILAGLVLGGRRGLLVGVLFIGLGLVGLPVLYGGRSVLAALPGPSVGYLVGYIFSPAVAGLIAYRAPRTKAGRAVTFALAGIAAVVVQYTCGSIGLMVRSGLDASAAALAQVPFIVPDAAKLVVIVIIALGVHAAFPDLIRRRATR